MTDDVLVSRILSAVPARSYEMSALLSLLRIEITTDVPTACVSCERCPVLRVNPRFVAEHCRSDEHLFLLVMHELHHVLLGHTRLFRRLTLAHNLAFDAVINAFLVQQFPGLAYRSFFVELYGDQDGVWRLLAPPGEQPLPDPRLASLHERLYGDGNTTAEEIFHTVAAAASETDDGIQVPTLLGTHPNPADDDGAGWGTDGPAMDGLVSAMRENVEKWPIPAGPRGIRGLADMLVDRPVAPIDPAEHVLHAMRRALTGAALRTGSAHHVALRPVLAQVPVPVMGDRRALVARASGATPLLHQASLSARGLTSGAADVYLDVSGSMNNYIAPLYGALTRLWAHTTGEVGLFSTKVVRIPLQKLVERYCETTGGTDIACVMADIARRRVKKVLLVTDGAVGAPAKEHVKALRRIGTEVRVLLTPEGWRQDLQGIAARVDELPTL